MANESATFIGRRLGNWKLLKLLGEGAFGAVFEAENTGIAGRRAAVKILHAHMSVQESIKQRFLNEASAASRAEHENIIQIFDGGFTDDGLTYSVMELLRGKTLTALLSQERLSVARTIHIAIQISSALQAAHDLNIVHRDLKPDNVFIVPRATNPEFVKVLDFGVCKLRDDQMPGNNGLTQTGMIVGTPGYMSPEQWMTLPDIDGRTDIYALGMILYRCLTGTMPFTGNTPFQWLKAHLERPVPDLHAQFDVPAPMAGIVRRMLAKSRDDRPRTMIAVIGELEEIRAALGVAAGPPPIELRRRKTGVDIAAEPQALESDPTMAAQDGDSPAKALAAAGGATAASDPAIEITGTMLNVQPSPLDTATPLPPAVKPWTPPVESNGVDVSASMVVSVGNEPAGARSSTAIVLPRSAPRIEPAAPRPEPAAPGMGTTLSVGVGQMSQPPRARRSQAMPVVGGLVMAAILLGGIGYVVITRKEARVDATPATPTAAAAAVPHTDTGAEAPPIAPLPPHPEVAALRADLAAPPAARPSLTKLEIDQLLSAAAQDLNRKEYEAAAMTARKIDEASGGGDPRAARILGVAACRQKHIDEALAAWARLRPEDRHAVKQACDASHIHLDGAVAAPVHHSVRPDEDDSYDELTNKEGEGAPAIPLQLEHRDVVAGMGAVDSAVTDCFEQHKIEGTVIASILIGNDGGVRSVNVRGPVAGTPGGQCITDAVKGATFKKFSGSPMSILFTFPH